MASNQVILDTYVNEQIPKLKTVQRDDLESMFESFSPEEMIAESEMTAEELVDTFRLSLITESLTDQYSETFQTGAYIYKAEWLKNYVVGFWEPDENGHADPFKNVLISFGIDKYKIDREISEARESVEYKAHHGSSLHPIALTTYGTIQECITDYWYELQRNFVPHLSNTSKVINKVKAREALHTIQFREMTALQLEQDPSLMEEIIHTAVTFSMPSNHIPLVADLEAKTRYWIPRMNGRVLELLRRIVLNINHTLNDEQQLGQLLMTYASTSERRFFRLIPNHIISTALGQVKGGYGLVGQVALDQLGLSTVCIDPQSNFIDQLTYRMRNVLKRWVTKRMQLEGYLRSP